MKFEVRAVVWLYVVAALALPASTVAQTSPPPVGTHVLGWPNEDLPPIRIASVVYLRLWFTNDSAVQPVQSQSCTGTLLSADPRAPDRPDLVFIATAAHCVIPLDEHHLGAGACLRRVDVHAQGGSLTLGRRDDRDAHGRACPNSELNRFDDFAVHMHPDIERRIAASPSSIPSAVLPLPLVDESSDARVADVLRREGEAAALDVAFLSIDGQHGRLTPASLAAHTHVAALRFDPRLDASVADGVGAAFPCTNPERPPDATSFLCRRVDPDRAYTGPRIAIERSDSDRFVLGRDPDSRTVGSGTELGLFQARGWDVLRPSTIDSGGGFFALPDTGAWPGWPNLAPEEIPRRTATLSGILSRGALSAGQIREVYVGRAPVAEVFCDAMGARVRRRFCPCRSFPRYQDLVRDVTWQRFERRCVRMEAEAEARRTRARARAH